jgi:hypothetical protein
MSQPEEEEEEADRKAKEEAPPHNPTNGMHELP